MKVLNLVNKSSSDIAFEHSKFPDGQQNITITDQIFINYSKQHSVVIKSRLNNFMNLEVIVCAVASLRELGVKEIHLYVPYILGSRSDRKFEVGGNNYLKTVICPILNSLNLDTIVSMDPHSDVLEACLNNFKKQSNINLVKFCLKDLDDNFVLVSPAAGASKKIYKVAEKIGYTGEIITCSKDRDKDGKLTKVIVPIKGSCGIPNKDIIIIDDICDGGTTFINIAKEINQYLDDDAKIYLIVTHGIFSKGFKELSEYFNGIYCTNSYSDLARYSNFSYLENVKQLNVF